MKFNQYLHVSPLAPYALGLFGLFLWLPVIPNAIALAEFMVRAWTGPDPWSFAELVRSSASLVSPLVVGGVFITAAIYLRRSMVGKATLKSQHPDQPWLRRKAWAERSIRLSNLGPSLAVLTLIACSLLVFITTAWTIHDQGWQGRNYWLPGVTAIVLFIGIRLYSVNRKWRRSELRLATLPGIIGGPLGGVVVLSEASPAATPFRLTLKCEQATWSRSDRESDRHATTIWQADTVVDKHLESKVPGTTALPLYFAIPFHCEPTTMDPDRTTNSVTTVAWWLSVSLKDDKLMRSVRFEVPMFKTPASSPTYREQPEMLADFVETSRPDNALQGISHRVESFAAGQRLHFSLFRWEHALLTIVLILLSFGGLLAVTYFVRPWPLTCIASLIPAVLFAGGGLSLLEMLLWKCSITILPDRLEIAAGYAGRRKSYNVRRGQVLGLKTEVEFFNAQSDRRRIRLVFKNGDSITVVKRLSGRQDAAAVRAWLAEQLGVAETPE